MFTHLYVEKENEAKLISLPTFLWKHENVMSDGMSDPSAVVSDSVWDVSKASEILLKS